MGWKDIDLSTVSVTIDPIAVGDYTLELLPGAKYNTTDAQKVEAQAAIVNGEFAGRRIFFSYPNPDNYEWSPKAFKRLELALGVESTPGEDPVEYLNRNANMRFGATISQRKDQNEIVRNDLKLFSVHAAA